MTRRFCDLCGDPAVELPRPLRADRAHSVTRRVGAELRGFFFYGNVSGSSRPFDDQVANADLCAKCAAELVHEIARKIYHPDPAAEVIADAPKA